jgi:hypothetical protein
MKQQKQLTLRRFSIIIEQMKRLWRPVAATRTTEIGTSGVGADPCVCPHNRANTQVRPYLQASRKHIRVPSQPACQQAGKTAGRQEHENGQGNNASVSFHWVLWCVVLVFYYMSCSVAFCVILWLRGIYT